MHINEYPDCTPENIWNFRQNHPELVVRDLREYLGLNDEQCEFVRKVLLARGVNKWLKVRRDLIAYKKQIKHEIKRLEKERVEIKCVEPRRARQLLEVSKALQKVRCTLKNLCMTDRWIIWPKGSIRQGLRKMNTLKGADDV